MCKTGMWSCTKKKITCWTISLDNGVEVHFGTSLMFCSCINHVLGGFRWPLHINDRTISMSYAKTIEVSLKIKMVGRQCSVAKTDIYVLHEQPKMDRLGISFRPKLNMIPNSSSELLLRWKTPTDPTKESKSWWTLYCWSSRLFSSAS